MYAAFRTEEQIAAANAAITRISRRAAKFRREAAKPGACVTTVYEAGQPSHCVVEIEAPAARPATIPAGNGTPRSQVTVTLPSGEKRAFSSCYVAFCELGLPVPKHVKFRAELKKDGSKVFEGGYLFAVGA